jgi:hypothetical protein
MQRLAFIRYMHDLGVEQAAKPEPYSWTAILTFHDAVELFLGLAASHHGADVRKDTKFVDYWKLIDDKIDSVRLLHSGRMAKLNDVRVAFKHHGNEPTPRMIEQSRRDVDLFFEDATPPVFGIAFNEIDLAAVIPHAEVAEYVRAATRHAEAGAFPMAMAGLSLAFDTLVAHYTMARSWYPGSMAVGPWPTSPLMFGESLRHARIPPFRGYAPR